MEDEDAVTGFKSRLKAEVTTTPRASQAIESRLCRRPPADPPPKRGSGLRVGVWPSPPKLPAELAEQLGTDMAGPGELLWQCEVMRG